MTSVWYGPEMGFMQSLALGKKMIMWLLGIPLVPIFCVIYIVSPKSKVLVVTSTQRNCIKRLVQYI